MVYCSKLTTGSLKNVDHETVSAGTTEDSITARDRVVRTYRPLLRRDGGRGVVTLPDDPEFRVELDLGPGA